MGPQNPHSYQFERDTFENTVKLARNFAVIDEDGATKLSNSNIQGMKAISTVSRLLHLFLGLQRPSTTSATYNKAAEIGVVYVNPATGWEKTGFSYHSGAYSVGKDQATAIGASTGDLVYKTYAFDTTNAIKSPSSVSRNSLTHYFPYFDGSIESYDNIVKDFISLYFARVFGKNEKAVAKGVTRIMGYWKSAAGTDVGQELTHLCFVCKLALDTGGLVTLIKDGEIYRGATRSATRWLLVEGNAVKPLAPASNKDAINAFYSAGGTLASIAVEISKLLMKDGSPATQVTAVDINTSAKLVEKCHEREAISSQNIRDALEPLITALKYDSEEFATVNQPNILSFLHGVKSNTVPSTPMYISIEVLVSQNPHYYQLARFGSTGPSFINPGGVKFDLFVKADDDPKAKSWTEKRILRQKVKGGKIEEKEEEVTRYGWDEIYILRRELPLAMKDLTMMIKERAIRQTEQSKMKSTAVKIKLEKGSGPVLVALRDFGNTEKLKGTSAKKTLGKRKYEEEVNVGNPADDSEDDDADFGMDL